MSESSYLIFECTQKQHNTHRSFYKHILCSENTLTVKLINLNILSTKNRTIPIIKNKLSSDTFFDYYYTPNINTHCVQTFYEAFHLKQ